MGHDCKNPRMVSVCDVQKLKDSVCDDPIIHESWGTCLPFGGYLQYENGSLIFNKSTPPPDGTYDRIIISGGCIVGVEKDERVPLYVGPVCAPVPGICGESSESGGGGTVCSPSTLAGNLYSCDPAGRPLVRVNINQGSGVTVTGNGTEQDPFVISVAGGGATVSGVYIKSGDSALEVTGSGSRTDPYEIQHKTTGVNGTKSGFTFDEYGHLIGFKEQTAGKPEYALIPGDGIDVSAAGSDVYTISLAMPTNNLQGSYDVGCVNMTLDHKNRITKIEEGGSSIAPGFYDVGGGYSLGIDGCGRIESVQHDDAFSALQGWKAFGYLVACGSSAYQDENLKVIREFTLPANGTVLFELDRLNWFTRASAVFPDFAAAGSNAPGRPAVSCYGDTGGVLTDNTGGPNRIVLYVDERVIYSGTPQVYITTPVTVSGAGGTTSTIQQVVTCRHMAHATLSKGKHTVYIFEENNNGTRGGSGVPYSCKIEAVQFMGPVY